MHFLFFLKKGCSSFAAFGYIYLIIVTIAMIVKFWKHFLAYIMIYPKFPYYQMLRILTITIAEMLPLTQQ